MRTVVVIAALWVSGCALDGHPIPDWTLDFGDTHGVAVTLPSNFLDVMAPTGPPFTLRTEVTVDVASRGRALTLVVPCFHDELALTVGGVSIDDVGDVGVGEHRYVLSAAQTDRDRLTLELAAQRNLVSFGFTVQPRLVEGVAGPTPSAVFDRALGVIELVLIGAFSLLYGLLYLLDRKRRAEGVFVIQSLAALGSVLAGLGVLGMLGDAMPAVFMVSVNIVNLSMLAYIGYALDLGPPSRRWFRIYIALSCLVALAPLSPPLSVAMLKVEFLVALAFTLHVFRRLLVARRRYRVDATLLIGAQVISILGSCFDIIQVVTAHNILGGVHIATLGILAWAVAQAIVLARRHVASEREVERVNAELRRQVAEHSREIVAALDQIAKLDEPDPIIDGRYRLVRRIGGGGMGIVHEVERISDHAHLALKLVRGATPEALARFAREAQIAAELQHANLLPVIDVGVVRGSLYLVMPLVADGSLESTRGRFGDPAWARGLLASIARGLAALHAHGVVHRDLKPANILLADGIPQIADFGLASLRIGDLADTTPSNLTRAGDVLGTPRYMAPELATGIRDVGPSSDIFSFGLIAHELLTGRPAFAEPPVLARRNGRPIDVPVLDDLDPIIARCLALAPETRPTAAELVVALAR